ncbi:MAG: hypothetical protein LBD30_04240 [Verrucomicrobiales bacterium]|jgi:hypothetical protein|nr:hypothetical protein [Verrucomicrobiales bacterium]
MPLTVTAASKIVSNGSAVESGSSYSDLYNPAALEVKNPGSSYTGADITLSANLPSATPMRMTRAPWP